MPSPYGYVTDHLHTPLLHQHQLLQQVLGGSLQIQVVRLGELLDTPPQHEEGALYLCAIRLYERTQGLILC